MNQRIGKVIEVFIPVEYKDNELIDVMDSTKIGFKVQVDDEILEIVQEQDENNSNILKDDLVLITEQTISGKYFLDIELYDGDYYG